jgi:hypothetical protein
MFRYIMTFSPTTKSRETKMETDWMNQKILGAEYVRRNYLRVKGDIPELVKQPLFRKFNADGVRGQGSMTADKSSLIQITHNRIFHWTAIFTHQQ